MTTFQDRHDAGRRLAALLSDRIDDKPLVLALPRGGVPVAAEVADALDAPLEVIAVRKIGAPGHPELGVGAVAEGGGLVLDQRILGQLGLEPDDVARTVEEERQEMMRRVTRYRGDRPLPDMAGRTVVIVDDGIATGVTARAAIRAVRKQQAGTIVLAVPACSASGQRDLAEEADDVVCATAPETFGAVGLFYEDFTQVTDEEVVDALQQHRERPPHTTGGRMSTTQAVTQPVVVTTGAVQLDGDLTIPARASGVVVFAHGSGSSRHSPRNQQVAEALQERGLGTLLFDLLSGAEEAVDRHTRELRFDIDLLASRLIGVTEWLASDEGTRHLRIGYFGASTGAAAALVAASRIPDRISGVVSRGGRPDLAGEALPWVTAPVQLIVGGDDVEVLDLNRQAAGQLPAEAELHIVEGATHLFEEPGALEEVAETAGAFLLRHMPPAS